MVVTRSEKTCRCTCYDPSFDVAQKGKAISIMKLYVKQHIVNPSPKGTFVGHDTAPCFLDIVIKTESWMMNM